MEATVVGHTRLNDGEHLATELEIHRVLHSADPRSAEYFEAAKRVTIVHWRRSTARRNRPPVPNEGRGVVFLGVRSGLPPEVQQQIETPLAGLADTPQNSWIPVANDAEVDALETSFTRQSELRNNPDPIWERSLSDRLRTRSAERNLAFWELTQTNSRLVENGAITLPSIRELSDSLSRSERKTLERALGRDDLPGRVRRVIVQSIAKAELKQLVPKLRNLAQDPDVSGAVLVALGTLKEPAGAEDLVASCRHPNPSVRKAAIFPLVETEGSDAVEIVGEMALSDSDSGVRMVAIEALGRIGGDEALAILGKTFVESDVDIRRKSASAFQSIGGPSSARELGRIVLEGPPEAQRVALAVLLGFRLPGDHPVLAQIRDSHPDPDTRRYVASWIERAH